MNRIQPLAWLPNTHGYRFVAVMTDGTRIKCRVVRGEDGVHRVEGAKFEDMKGWMA